MKLRLRNWLIVRRIESDYGLWYVPATEQLIVILSGVIGFTATSNALLGFLSGLTGLIIIRGLTAILGYLDRKYIKGIAYRNSYMANDMNPFFKDMDKKLNEIIKRLDELEKQ